MEQNAGPNRVSRFPCERSFFFFFCSGACPLNNRIRKFRKGKLIQEVSALYVAPFQLVHYIKLHLTYTGGYVLLLLNQAKWKKGNLPLFYFLETAPLLLGVVLFASLGTTGLLLSLAMTRSSNSESHAGHLCPGGIIDNTQRHTEHM